jgi:hypothetical protein
VGAVRGVGLGRRWSVAAAGGGEMRKRLNTDSHRWKRSVRKF